MSATAVHSLWTTASGVTSAAPGNSFTAPKIEYTQLMPVLIIVVAAVLGILVEPSCRAGPATTPSSS